MKLGKTREELENTLIKPTLAVKRTRKGTERVKKHLLHEHQILGGNVQMWLNNPKKELLHLDWRALCLFADQIYKETRNSKINPKTFYTEIEMKKALQYMGNLIVKEDLSLPLKFDQVTKINNNQFITKISVKTLAQLSSLLLNYNFDIQRESKKIVRKGETIREATLVMENVEEIKNNLKKGTQETTAIVINASAGTADEGDELFYSSEDNSLIINKGTILDIVDGYHRCRASELAINENPNIEFEFIVLLLNYTDDMAMNYQGQFAKQTPISTTRQKQLSKPRSADIIVEKLMLQSSLKGRVSTETIPSLKSGELVSYDVLTNAIESEFNLERVVDVHRAEHFLRTFFDIMLESYSEQFLDNPIKWKKKSVIAESNMFIGYITLAKRMHESNIPEVKLIDLLGKIDFSRDNPLWVDIGFLTKEKTLNKTRIARKAIKNFFNKVKL